MATKITSDMFSVRSLRVLVGELKLETLEQVTEFSEWDLRRQPNFGLKSLREIKEVLAKYDLSLASKSSWKPPEAKPACVKPRGPEYPDMLRALRRIAEFPLAETTSPDSAAAYMRAVARYILRSGKES